MLTLSPSGAIASTVSAAAFTAPQLHPTAQPTAQPIAQASGAAPRSPMPSEPYSREQVRHLLFGTLTSIQATIRLLHKLGYAEPNDWSRPMSTGKANEMMAILTKRVVADSEQ